MSVPGKSRPSRWGELEENVEEGDGPLASSFPEEVPVPAEKGKTSSGP
jgi:hypothetical protein